MLIRSGRFLRAIWSVDRGKRGEYFAAGEYLERKRRLTNVLFAEKRGRNDNNNRTTKQYIITI